VKRGARSRARRSNGGRQALASPLAPVLLGVLLLLALGYWVTKDEQAPAPAAAPASEAGVAGEASAEAASPAQAGEESETASTQSTGDQQPLPVEAAAAGTDAAAEAGAWAEAYAQGWAPAASRSAIDRSGGAAETTFLTVYYLDDQTGGLTLQPVQIKVPATATPVADALEHLLHPPLEVGFYGEFPPGTTAGAPDLVGGVAVVELSPEVEAVRGEAADAVMASLVYTLTEIPGVDAVLLRVDGRPAELDGFVWSEPVSRADLEAWNLYQVEPVILYGGG